MARRGRPGVDLLLSHGYVLADDEHEREIMMPYPPLGILYLSSHLKAKGFSVEIYDATFGSLDGFREGLEQLAPRTVGLYCNLMTKRNVLAMVRICREQGVPVVLGGPEPAAYAAEYLGRGATAVVVGEGETTLEELVPALAAPGRDDLGSIRGITFLDESGQVRSTSPRPQLRPLDAQPWPDRDAIDIGAYLDTWRTNHGYSSMSLITARGCPYTCTWCSHSVFGQTHRRRSVRDVADELCDLAERWGPDRLWYADDVFTLNRPWTLEYARELARRGLRLPFECISRADRINERIADALAEMGCFRLWIGSESGSQRVLDAMKRLTTAEDVRVKTALLKARGIQVGMFVMLGYEGEEESDLDATVRHLQAAQPDVFLTTVAYPIRGTPYYEQVEDRLLSDLAWEERTDRDLGVAGRPSRRYYRHATRWIVERVALHRALRARPVRPLRVVRHMAGVARGRLGMLLARGQRERATSVSGRGWGEAERRARGGMG